MTESSAGTRAARARRAPSRRRPGRTCARVPIADSARARAVADARSPGTPGTPLRASSKSNRNSLVATVFIPGERGPPGPIVVVVVAPPPPAVANAVARDVDDRALLARARCGASHAVFSSLMASDDRVSRAVCRSSRLLLGTSDLLPAYRRSLRPSLSALASASRGGDEGVGRGG